MKKPTISYEKIMDLCVKCNLQPNHLFACFRKTLGISQAKLAYRLDHEHITQNTISRYEHKNLVDANYEYILWKWLIDEINSRSTPSRIGASRFIAMYIAPIELYILRYANRTQVRDLQAALLLAISGEFGNRV